MVVDYTDQVPQLATIFANQPYNIKKKALVIFELIIVRNIGSNSSADFTLRCCAMELGAPVGLGRCCLYTNRSWPCALAFVEVGCDFPIRRIVGPG